MNVTAANKRNIYVLWLLIVPFAFYAALNFFPSNSYDYLNMIIYLLFLIAIMMISIPVDRVSITLERWIIFSLFFQYGVLSEMVFMQIAMFVLLFTLKSSTPKTFRFAFNSIVFSVVSLVGGYVFYAFGGSLQNMSLANFFIAGFIYASVYSLVNSALLILIFKMLKQKNAVTKKAVLWDFVVTILLLPFAIIFTLLFQQISGKAFLLIGVPFILVLLVTSKYLKSDILNDLLSSAAVIGHHLAESLRVDDVLRTFVEKIKNVIPYESAYIIDLRVGGNLIMLSCVEGEFQRKEAMNFSFPSKNNVKDGLDVEMTKMYLTRKSLSALNGFTFAPSVESVLAAPVKRDGKTEGFLILTSNQKYAFDEVQTKMVDLLTSYFATAMVKARYYEKTVEKSTRCALTGIHNYHYLEQKLDEEIVHFHTGEVQSLSAIMLDIDHFKSINDTYGHQSGNDLLVSLANLLSKFQHKGMTLARYGGEEFTIILPNFSKDEAIKLAELIRKDVEKSKFEIIPDLSDNNEPINVQMTISLGVATMPEDAKDGKDLLRNADRALYIGGKQAGRNRVGIYEENSGMKVTN
ncbi:sensor domain-containing diguanylate cyclase [Sporosarcina thermotolerans]|uniref:Sensor domain-containing diguanylate cyclase n=1 Tax=Sporosarcina thermotolerans TaxID=633404 RepID=A0AAW9AES5_9BACL|nr:sensor domain-containing diguanylate cyclase [Sporosarcina thermotolerans]MDW0118108.1 sensor domain-containing diguanylate cyclase [Sporosarcina thermotolerans]